MNLLYIIKMLIIYKIDNNIIKCKFIILFQIIKILISIIFIIFFIKKGIPNIYIFMSNFFANYLLFYIFNIALFI